MGGSREDMVEMASAMALGITQPLENMQFSMMLGGAVRAFLSNPQDIALSVEPPSPVPLSEIFASAIADPKSLVDVLAVKVEANGQD